MEEKFDSNRLGPREVPLYELDRVPHATSKLLDDLHTVAELQRSFYAGSFYRERQAGPGMEYGMLTVPVEELIFIGDCLRRYAFVEKVVKEEKQKIFYLVFHPQDKSEMLKFFHERLGKKPNFKITRNASHALSQEDRKAIVRSLKLSSTGSRLVTKKKVMDSMIAAAICGAINTNDISLIEAKVQELGKRIINMPLDPSGTTMLHYASRICKYDVVYNLLQQGADPKVTLMDGRTALEIVNDLKRQDREAEITTYLLSNKTISEAIREKAYHYVRYAIEELHHDVNEKNAYNMIPLAYALRDKAYDFCRFLVRNGADLFNENRIGARTIDECKDKEIRNELLSIYKEQYFKRKEVDTAKTLKDMPSREKSFFWGNQNIEALPKHIHPNVETKDFSKWYENKFRGWSTYVNKASQYDQQHDQIAKTNKKKKYLKSLHQHNKSSKLT